MAIKSSLSGYCAGISLRSGLALLWITSDSLDVERAPDAKPILGSHVCVNHGGLYAGVAEQLLNGPDIVALFQ